MITQLQEDTIAGTMALIDQLTQIIEEGGGSESIELSYGKLRKTVDKFLGAISEEDRNRIIDRYSEIKRTGRYDAPDLQVIL